MLRMRWICSIDGLMAYRYSGAPALTPFNQPSNVGKLLAAANRITYTLTSSSASCALRRSGSSASEGWCSALTYGWGLCQRIPYVTPANCELTTSSRNSWAVFPSRCAESAIIFCDSSNMRL